jgi:CpXC protein
MEVAFYQQPFMFSPRDNYLFPSTNYCRLDTFEITYKKIDMTVKNTIEVTCPRCGVKTEALRWYSLNSRVDPDDKQLLIDGKVNLFKCSRCDLTGPMDTGFFMFHDEEQQYVAYVFSLKDIDNAKFLDSFSSDGSYDMDLPVVQEAKYFCHPHYVFSMEELARYVKFRDKLFAFQNLSKC